MFGNESLCLRLSRRGYPSKIQLKVLFQMVCITQPCLLPLAGDCIIQRRGAQLRIARRDLSVPMPEEQQNDDVSCMSFSLSGLGRFSGLIDWS